MPPKTLRPLSRNAQRIIAAQSFADGEVGFPWRGLATRHEKTATIFKAGLHIAGIFIWSAR